LKRGIQAKNRPSASTAAASNNATTITEIDAAFASFARERPDALLVHPDGFFVSRAVQFATLAAREKIPAAYPVSDMAAVGGLMSYGTDTAEMFRQVRRLYGHHP
jgi:putative ABC transport system substrate-binding protein